jgi:aerobic-type carbon monoxide dehydrogenase small subunit (CoxS/CutS family)
MNRTVRTTVNGREVEVDVTTRSLLGEVLRDELGLTGTKLSCGMQVCGVCTVLVDGQPISSCTYLAIDAEGRRIETVEGLATDGDLHPLQRSFIDTFGLQCGFCTPGFLMTAKALLDENPSPTTREIEEHLEGNLCRCTGYESIVKAVALAAERANGERHGA